MNLSLEDKLLRYYAQIDINDKAKNRLDEILHNDLNWSYILQESINEGIAYLFYHNLLQFKNGIRQDIWNKFKEIYYTNIYQNTKIYQEMNIVLSSFNKENVKVIPLKGIFLAEKIYNNIGLRAMGDIDLLIKKEDLSRIDKLLEDIGYRSPIHKELRSHAIEKSYMNSIDYFKTGEKSPILHIHWHIVNVSLPTYMYTKNIKMDKFWEYAKPVKIADTETLQLAPHHLIIHLAEHALKHSFDRLTLLSDINAATKRYREQIKWEKLIKETMEFGMERQLFYGLYFTKYFLEADIPDYVLSRLKPKKIGLLERRFFNAVSNNRRNTKLCYFVYLNMVKGVINKLRFIFRTLFPPPCTLALFFNLNKPRVTVKDYLLFLGKRLSYLRNCLSLLRPR